MDAGPGPDRDHDRLPPELDATLTRELHVFPDTGRRRYGALTYLVVAAACLTGGIVRDNVGFLAAAVVLLAVAVHHLVTAWRHRVDQTDALAIAGRTLDFPMGHASVQLAWRGPLSRPTWRVLAYSAEEPPRHRGLVEVDARDGEVIGSYREENPEDWSTYDAGEDAPGT